MKELWCDRENIDSWTWVWQTGMSFPHLYTIHNCHCLFEFSGLVCYLDYGLFRGLYFFFYFHLSCLSNVLSFGRRLNMTEILWFRLLNPNIVVSYCRGRHPLVLVNCLEGLSLPRNSATINWSAQHDLIVDWAVKLQHKQTNTINVSVWVNFNMSAAKLCHLQLKVS